MKHLAVIVALVVVLVPSARGIQAPGVIRVTDTALYQKWTTAGILTVSSVYNRSIAPYSIGNAQQICVPIGGRGPLTDDSRYCWATYSIGTSGSLQVHGVARSLTYYQLAIVGGTGRYNNVGGTLTVIRYTRNPVRQRLVFRLTYP